MQLPKRLVRKLASGNLSQLTGKGDRHAITEVVACLEHEDGPVGELAVRTLSQLADKGDQHDITEVAARLEHEDWPVRVGRLYPLSVGGEQ